MSYTHGRADAMRAALAVGHGQPTAPDAFEAKDAVMAYALQRRCPCCGRPLPGSEATAGFTRCEHCCGVEPVGDRDGGCAT